MQSGSRQPPPAGAHHRSGTLTPVHLLRAAFGAVLWQTGMQKNVKEECCHTLCKALLRISGSICHFYALGAVV